MRKAAFILTSLLVVALATTSSVSKKKKPRKEDELITIKTKYGEMQMVLFDDCPIHKQNFLKLASQGYYDSTTFHRVINDFMIQGGDPFSKDDDPTNDGMGGPGYTLEKEISKRHPHVRGAVAAARKQNPEMRSSGSQFYIVQSYSGTPQLDGQYTVFGQVVKGMTIVDIIANAPKDYKNRPYKNIYMTVSIDTLKREKITELTGYQYEK